MKATSLIRLLCKEGGCERMPGDAFLHSEVMFHELQMAQAKHATGKTRAALTVLTARAHFLHSGTASIRSGHALPHVVEISFDATLQSLAKMALRHLGHDMHRRLRPVGGQLSESCQTPHADICQCAAQG